MAWHVACFRGLLSKSPGRGMINQSINIGFHPKLRDIAKVSKVLEGVQCQIYDLAWWMR